jgi:general secretion pathway protein M
MKAELAQTWAGFWDGRTEREKTLLLWGGVALGVVIAWSILLGPALDGRAHLRESLPAIQRQLAQMTAQADEARSLSSAVQGVTPTGGALKDALTASLTEHGLVPLHVDHLGRRCAQAVQGADCGSPHHRAQRRRAGRPDGIAAAIDRQMMVLPQDLA